MYGLFENNKITIYPSLPKSWRNISGLNLLTNEVELKRLGWYKVILDSPEYNPETQEISNYTYFYDYNSDQVKQQAIIVEKIPLTQEEIDLQIYEKRLSMVCTNYQARQVLVLAGLYDSVQSAMNDPNVDISAKLAWEYAANFYRISPFISSIAQSLGLSDEQLDDLFEQAMSIGV